MLWLLPQTVHHTLPRCSLGWLFAIVSYILISSSVAQLTSRASCCRSDPQKRGPLRSGLGVTILLWLVVAVVAKPVPTFLAHWPVMWVARMVSKYVNTPVRIGFPLMPPGVFFIILLHRFLQSVTPNKALKMDSLRLPFSLVVKPPHAPLLLAASCPRLILCRAV